MFFQEHILPKPRAYYRVEASAEPDVWLDAVQVWEVKCADLSLSPVYKAAMGMVSSSTTFVFLFLSLAPFSCWCPLGKISELMVATHCGSEAAAVVNHKYLCPGKVKGPNAAFTVFSRKIKICS